MSETLIVQKKSQHPFSDWVRHEASRLNLPDQARKIAFTDALSKSQAETKDLRKYFSALPAVKAVPKAQRGALLDSFNTYYAAQRSAIISATSNFVGYSYLSFLANDPLINRGVSVIADEMVREWGYLTCRDDITTEVNESKSAAIKVVNEDLERLNAKEIFRQAGRTTGFFGGLLAYLDLRGPSGEMPDDEELQKPIYADGKDDFNRAKLQDLTLHGIRLIEPINITPGEWNSTDPLAPDFYEPETFYVLGKRVHRSRFLYFADNLPPQVLKPCYLFFGISTSQMAADYVSDFYHMKNAVTKMLTKYSLTYFATQIDALVEHDGPSAVADRVATMAKYRDNDSMLIVDSASERIDQINTPLGGIKDIWYATLELLPVIFGVPATKLLEISPSGFQATGEFDMRNFYDSIAVKQSNVFDQPMKKLIDILCLVNRIDNPGLIWKWNSLYKLSEREQAEVNRIKAETSSVLYSIGAVSAENIAQNLKSDETSGYENIDLPEPAEPEPEDDRAAGTRPPGARNEDPAQEQENG